MNEIKAKGEALIPSVRTIVLPATGDQDLFSSECQFWEAAQISPTLPNSQIEENFSSSDSAAVSTKTL